MTLPATDLGQTLALFFLSALIVWIAGARLAYLADALSDRLNLAKSIVGLVFLSTATSLPEIATTLTAAVQSARDLVVNNLFGGIALQTAILAMSDFWARGAITNYPRKANHALEATLLVLMLGLAIIVITIGEPVAFGRVGLGSLIIGLVYIGALWLLRTYDDASDWVPVDLPDPDPLPFPAPTGLRDAPTRSLIAQAVLACIAILLFGVLLVTSAERIAEQTGLGAGFIGVTLLAAATSLPELTTSITAVRMGAYTLAISNIFGSNLIMLVLVLPADLLFRDGPLLRETAPIAIASLGFAILVTAVFLTGLLIRRKPRIGQVGLDSVLVLITFAASLLIYYQLR
ncbi:MAG: sodium:calcium antiporter [Arenibacterium sp.]